MWSFKLSTLGLLMALLEQVLAEAPAVAEVPAEALSISPCRDRSHYFDRTASTCRKCAPCFKDSDYRVDYAIHKEECRRKNLEPRVRGQTKFVLWCDVESRRFKELFSTSTVPPQTTPSTFKTTQEHPTTTDAKALPVTTAQTSGLQHVLPLTVGIVVVGVLAIVLALLWRRYGCRSRHRPSQTTSSSGQSGRPLLPKVTVSPGTTINEGTAWTLETTNPWTDTTGITDTLVVWQNEGRPEELHFGKKIYFPEAYPWHAGKWIIYFGGMCYDPYITIYIIRNEWRNELLARRSAIEYPPEARPTARESTDTGIDGSVSSGRATQVSDSIGEAAEGSQSTGRPTESADSSETVSLNTDSDTGYSGNMDNNSLDNGQQQMVYIDMPPDMSLSPLMQPQSSDRTSIIAPSSVMHNAVSQLQNLRNLMATPITRSGCTLYLQELLNKPEAMMQLAILMDPTSALRVFASVIGGLTSDEINYIWYATRGRGNTVRGLLDYVMQHKPGGRQLTVADLSRHLITVRWQGCDKVVELLHFVHQQCVQCANLYAQYGPVSESNRVPPGYTYHITDRFVHCNQTIETLARLLSTSEPFRQESSIYFMPDDLWWRLGRELVGMMTEKLEWLETHYRRLSGHEDNCYLKVLDMLTAMYPDMKVATLIQWCLDQDKPNAAEVVLKYHKRYLIDGVQQECPFCRQFR